MAPRSAVSSTSRRWLVGVLVTVLTVVAIALTLLAVDHVRMRPTGGDVAPVPAFTQPARETPSPTPSETSTTVASYDRSEERFLTVSAGVLWRGTAGQCGAVEPLLERSADGGETWTDVTPRYLGIGQLVALNPFADGQAEIIATMGEDCEVQALRTFTQGQFWESYPEVLAASQYVDPADAGSIVRAGSSIAAPCADALSLHVAESALTTVCDGTAYVLDQDAEWQALLATNVVAVNLDGGEVVVAHVSEQCDGVAVTRYTSAGEAAQDVGCADVEELNAPAAIAGSDGDILIWSGTSTAFVASRRT